MASPSTIRDLKNRYELAVKRGEETFTIDGFEFVTDYAKYLLQYFGMCNVPETTELRSMIRQEV